LARLRLLNILAVCLRRLNPRRLDCIFDLKLVLPVVRTPSSTSDNSAILRKFNTPFRP
jgi:hypothetical protein